MARHVRVMAAEYSPVTPPGTHQPFLPEFPFLLSVARTVMMQLVSCASLRVTVLLSQFQHKLAKYPHIQISVTPSLTSKHSSLACSSTLQIIPHIHNPFFLGTSNINYTNILDILYSNNIQNMYERLNFSNITHKQS